MIRLEDVSVMYGHTRALRALELTLLPGVTGLFGQNASGKSTLLRVLAGLLRPTEGTVTVDGRTVTAADEEWRRRVGYAGHSSGLYARLTVRENLELFGALYGASARRIQDTIDALGLADRSSTPVGALSAGFKRRAAVARALLHEPDVLLLDEPYANLDDDASALVSAAVTAWRGQDRIGLIASHGAKKVKAFADASIILQRGSLISYRVGSPERAEA